VLYKKNNFTFFFNVLNYAQVLKTSIILKLMLFNNLIKSLCTILVQSNTTLKDIIMSNIAQQSVINTRANGAKSVQGVGVSKHARLGYKARFSGEGLTCAARFNHLNKVKENGIHAHDEVFMMQLNRAVSELTAALFMRNQFDKRANTCTEKGWYNGYTENHLNAIIAFINSHSQSAIAQSEGELEGLDVVEKEGIFG
jgi:hypothetical protein